MVVRALDLRGEAAAGAQRVAAVRMTMRATAEIFMVPRAEAVGDAFVVSGSSAGMLCSSGRPFIDARAAEEVPPPSDWGSFHSKHQTLAAVTSEIHRMETKTEISSRSV